MPLFPKVAPDAPAATPARPERTLLPGAPEHPVTGLRSVPAHREVLLHQVPGLRPFGMGLLEAAGLTLCETIVADLDLPTYTAATCDGWAVRASTLAGASPRLPVVLRLAGTDVRDGRRAATLPAGTTVRIVAGAPVPDGADAVVPEAAGELTGDGVRFTADAHFAQHMLPAGSRVADGEILAPRGTLLTPRVLGMIAEIGHDKVLARPRPRVVVMTADAALVEPGRPLTRRGEGYDACTTLLAATARADGAQVFGAGIVTTDPRGLGTALDEQLVRADLLLLVAEVTDALVDVLARSGAVDVTEVDALPGRQAFALVGPERSPVLVVPPGTVTAYLAYLLFGRPLVRRLAGLDEDRPAGVAGFAEAVDVLAAPVAADPVRPRLVLARRVESGLVPLSDPGATELAGADAVLVVPPGDGALPVGAAVACQALD